MQKYFPISCPGCHARLKVQSFYCESCDTDITGSFSLPVFLKLDQKEQDFIMRFVENSGSFLRFQMERTSAVSIYVSYLLLQ